MKILKDVKLGLDEDLKERLALLSPDFTDYRVLRESLDARKRHDPHFIYSVLVAGPGEKINPPKYYVPKISLPASFKPDDRPLIVGSGPAGLFAALRLVERGIPCQLFERGSRAEVRIKGINQYWRYGKLDPEDNVCFGEGGAGLYSDGKLITRIKSPDIPYVMNRLVQFGAPAEIEYLSNPHVGSDRIRRVIPKLREYLIQNGCEMHFNQKVEKILFEAKKVVGIQTKDGITHRSPQVILATGHSSEDMLEHLSAEGVFIEGKSFAMGLRIEHPQSLINKIQYREAAEHPRLGSANYKLAHHDKKEDVGVYSFCMCPGGFVLSSGTEADGLVCNGMSNYRRNSPYANAAIVVSVDHESYFGKDLQGGLKLRREIEKEAYQRVQRDGGTKELPGQQVMDFVTGKTSKALSQNSSPSGARSVRLDDLFPKKLSLKIKEGLEKFNQNLPGFISEKAMLFGVETRTSCPIRVTRNEDTLESLSHSGLFPCGEGAGYAGGITSAACDGIKIADKIAESLSSQSLEPVLSHEAHLLTQ